MVGRYPASGFLTPNLFQSDEMARTIVTKIRIPRIIVAMLLGAVLAAAGTVMQMIFANPLVNPGFLGVTHGAALGAAMCILFLGNSAWKIQLFSSLFACMGLAISYFIAWKMKYGSWILRLILAGIAVSAIFTSLLGFMKYLADPTHQLAEITFWLLGGLSGVTWTEVYHIFPIILLSLVIMVLFRWRINILALRDSVSFSLGVSSSYERIFILTVAVIGVAAATSVSGVIGWIGLIVPHISRRIFGADARYSLPGSIILGSIIVLLCDDFCRSAFTGEIPLGIVTSLLGAVCFLALMTTHKKKHS